MIVIRYFIYIISVIIIFFLSYNLFNFVFKKINDLDEEFYKNYRKNVSQTSKNNYQKNTKNNTTYRTNKNDVTKEKIKQEQQQFKYHQEQSYKKKEQFHRQQTKKINEEKNNNLPHCIEILGFTKMPNNIDEIKTRYKKLTKIYHPDSGGTEEEFERIKEAYEDALRLFKK